jgi:hypothetical protein
MLVVHCFVFLQKYSAGDCYILVISLKDYIYVIKKVPAEENYTKEKKN